MIYALSISAILFYAGSRMGKKKHHKVIQPEKFRALDTFMVAPKKHVISDAAYEWAEKQVSNSK